MINFQECGTEVAIIMGTLPLAHGRQCIWLMYLAPALIFSVAVGVGFIALAGVVC